MSGRSPLALTLPEPWREVKPLPSDPKHTRAFTYELPESQGFARLAPIKRRKVMPPSREGIVAGIRRALPPTSALIEADAVTSESGVEIAYSIVKTLLDGNRLQYNLTAHIGRDDAHQLQAFFEEVGRAGVREDVGREMWRRSLLKSKQTEEDRPWARDPYSGETVGYLMTEAEHAAYDVSFPKHPLSMARRLLAESLLAI